MPFTWRRKGSLPRPRRALRLEPLEDRTLLNAGGLDPTFGQGGKVLSTFSFPASVQGTAVAPDGKIVVVGTSTGIDTSSIIVMRYNNNGTLDSTFGSGGQVALSMGSGPEVLESAAAVAITPGGKIIVAGTFNNLFGGSGSEFALARLNANGTLDTHFGKGGTVLTAFSLGAAYHTDAFASAVALAANGQIIVAGSATAEASSMTPLTGPITHQTPFTDFAIARYNADGSLDKHFGNAGKVLTSFSDGVSQDTDTARSVVIQADGKIVVGGIAQSELRPGGPPTSMPPGGTVMYPDYIAFSSNLALARYNSDGSLDTHFGKGGKALASSPDGPVSQGAGVALDSDGRLVVAGSTGDEITLARFNSHGVLDSNFGKGGVTTTMLKGVEAVTANAIVASGHDRTVVVGTATLANGKREFVLEGFNADGSPNRNFGVGGTVLTAFGGDSGANAGALQARGSKLIAAGFGPGHTGSSLLFTGIALARYQM